MAGIQRQDASVVIQPSGVVQTANLGLDSAMVAQGWNQLSSSLMTGFDMVKRQADRDDALRAAQDAPAMITRDGNGLVVPPKSFDAPGGFFQSQAYKDAYKNSLFNHYSTMAEQDFSNYAQTVAAQHPTDVDAARAKLAERRAAMVQELDPAYAPLITLKLNGMSGQVESRISANAQIEKNKVTEERAMFNYQNVVLQAAQLAQLPAKFDAETLAVNNAQLGADFKRATDMMYEAGYTKERVDRLWEQARVKSLIARDTTALKEAVFVSENSSGADRDAQVLHIRQEISRTAQKLGADGPAYESGMIAALNEAQTRNQLRQNIIDGKAEKETLYKGWQAQTLIRNGGSDLGLGQDEILRNLRASQNEVYTDPNLSDAQKVKRLAMYEGVVQSGTAEFANYTAQRATQLFTQATDINTPPDRAKAMMGELVQMSKDPAVYSHLPVGTRNYIDRAISSIATNEAKMDLQGVASAMEAGLVDPKNVRDDVYPRLVARGIVGDAPNALIRPDAFKALEMRSAAAWFANKSQRAEAIAGAEAWRTGNMPTKTQRDALEASLSPYSTPDGKPFSFTGDGHVASAVARFNVTGNLPKPMEEAFKEIVVSDPNQAKAASAAMYQIRDTLRDKGIDMERANDIVGTMIGNQTAGFLRNVHTMGQDLALNLYKSSVESVSRNLQQSEPGAAADISKSVDAAVGRLTKESEPGLPARLFGLNEEQQWVRRQLGDAAPTLLDQVGASLKAGQAGYSKIELSPEVRPVVEELAMGILKRDGVAMATSNKNVPPGEQAAMQALEMLREQTELVPSKDDPKKATIGYRTANSMLGGLLGQGRLDDETTGKMALILFRADQQARRELGLPEKMLPPFKETDVGMVRTREKSGEFTWTIAARSGIAGVPVTLLKLDDNDPRLSAFAGDLIQQTADSVSRAMPRPDAAIERWMGGSFGWKLLGKLALMPQTMLFQDRVKELNMERRIDQLSNVADQHTTKQMWDSIFETNTARDAAPLIGLNPIRWLFSATGEGTKETNFSQLRKAMEKDADFEHLARNAQLMEQMLHPANALPRTKK